MTAAAAAQGRNPLENCALQHISNRHRGPIPNTFCDPFNIQPSVIRTHIPSIASLILKTVLPFTLPTCLYLFWNLCIPETPRTVCVCMCVSGHQGTRGEFPAQMAGAAAAAAVTGVALPGQPRPQPRLATPTQRTTPTAAPPSSLSSSRLTPSDRVSTLTWMPPARTHTHTPPMQTQTRRRTFPVGRAACRWRRTSAPLLQCHGWLEWWGEEGGRDGGTDDGKRERGDGWKLRGSTLASGWTEVLLWLLKFSQWTSWVVRWYIMGACEAAFPNI